MDIDEITNELKKKREQIDLEIQKEEELKEKKIKIERQNLYADIRSLAPRIKKLITLGKALYKYGFMVATCSREPNYLGTNERYPHIGFNNPNKYRNYYKDNPDIFYIGISHNDLNYQREASTYVSLWVDEDGGIIVTDRSERYVVFGDNHLKTCQLKQFLEEFDVFEKKVYDYATSLVENINVQEGK